MNNNQQTRKRLITAIKTFILISFVVSITCLGYTASAAIDPISPTECIAWGLICAGGPTPQAIIINYIWAGLNVVMGFLATITAAALIYYGILYIISRGDENQITKAKTGIIYALLGLLLVGTAAWLVNAVINL